MQATVIQKTCTSHSGNEPCRGACPGYQTRATCPPLIVVAVLQSHTIGAGQSLWNGRGMT